jgi:hypothetical protein
MNIALLCKVVKVAGIGLQLVDDQAVAGYSPRFVDQVNFYR